MKISQEQLDALNREWGIGAAIPPIFIYLCWMIVGIILAIAWIDFTRGRKHWWVNDACQPEPDLRDWDTLWREENAKYATSWDKSAGYKTKLMKDYVMAPFEEERKKELDE